MMAVRSRADVLWSDTCTDTQYNTVMVRTFRHRGLKRLFQDGDASKVRADQIKRITRCWLISIRRYARRTLTFPDIACTL